MRAVRHAWRTRVGSAARMLARDPGEFLHVAADRADRAFDRTPLRARPSWPRRPLEEVIAEAGDALGLDLAGHLREDGFAAIEAEVAERIALLGPNPPFPVEHNASPSLQRLTYALCRALRPAAVLETGVAHGVTSSFVAKALSVNGGGELHSVDRAPVRPGVDAHIGSLVPEELRSRWTLHRGSSRRLLPPLLPTIEGLSLFIHDSQHTYRNIAWELRTVEPHLRPPAAVIVDDTAGNRAFEHWAERTRPAFAAIVDHEMVGVAIIAPN